MRVLAFLTAILFCTPASAVTDVLEPSDLDPVNQTLQELQAAQEDMAKRLLKLESRDTKPPPPPPPTGGLFEDLAYNAWMRHGPAISSIWSQVDPPLDPLTRGVEGLRATVTQWCGAGFDKAQLKFRKSCGGHRSTGVNWAYGMDISAGTIAWVSPDSRLVGSEMPDSACPYPSEHQTLGDRAGPAAGHWEDGIVTATDGSTLVFPYVLYDCKGPGNRQPGNRVFKLSPDGEWSSSGAGNYTAPSGGISTEPLPDGKILLIGRYFAGIFDPEVMRLVPFKARGKLFEAKGKYAELGAHGNLTEAGTTSDGALRFFHSAYKREISEIHVTKDEDGLWNVGGPREIVGVEASWYTAGMEWLPDHNALMYWGGACVRYILFDGETPETRIGTCPDLDLKLDSKTHIHEGGLQWDPVNKVVYAFGFSSREGLLVFRPPQNLRASTEPPLPPKVDLQAMVDAAEPGDTLALNEPRYTGANLNKDGLTLVCSPGTTISGPIQGKGVLLWNAKDLTLRGCDVPGGHNSDNNLSSVWGEAAGVGGTFENNTFRDSDNGILVSQYASGTYIVRNNTFTNLGAGGRGHAYYGSPMASTSIIEGNLFEKPKGEGHLIKSRSARTEIRDNKIYGNTAVGEPVYSRLIDIPDGGHIVIENNDMRHGKPPGNSDAACIGCEYNARPDKRPGRPVEDNSILITGNTVQGFGPPSMFLNIHSRLPAEVFVDPAQIANDNQISGFKTIVSGR